MCAATVMIASVTLGRELERKPIEEPSEQYTLMIHEDMNIFQ